jgi:hypothetical protein
MLGALRFQACHLDTHTLHGLLLLCAVVFSRVWAGCYGWRIFTAHWLHMLLICGKPRLANSSSSTGLLAVQGIYGADLLGCCARTACWLLFRVRLQAAGR